MVITQEHVGARPSTYETADMFTGEIVTAWVVPHPDEFMDEDYLNDERLDALLDSVIEEFPELDWLTKYRFRIIWKRKGSGKHPLGTCQVASGLTAYFADVDFIITLSANLIRAAVFTETQMRALVFHELMHCAEKGDDEPMPAVRGHDLEVFAGELVHFGAWMSDIEAMRGPFRQLELRMGGAS